MFADGKSTPQILSSKLYVFYSERESYISFNLTLAV